MAIEPIFESASHRNERPFRPAALRLGPLTVVLIAICAAVAFFSKLGHNDDFVEKLLISRGGQGSDGVPLPEIFDRQVWRVLTPIFLHFGIVHLLFNMLWLKDLGTVIERLVGTRVLLGLVLVAGVFSNLGQFVFSGPFFGGMSGVVYALLGYVWMKSRFDPASGFFLDKQTVIMMVGWFFLCMTGAVGPVANYAHGFGLVIGMVWGFVSAKTRSHRGSFPVRF